MPQANRVHAKLALSNNATRTNPWHMTCHYHAGYHATVFAYGQTGSGKTYTMEGFRYSAPTAKGKAPAADFENTPPQQLGITPRAVHALFAALSANTERRFSVRCSYVQVRWVMGKGQQQCPAHAAGHMEGRRESGLHDRGWCVRR